MAVIKTSGRPRRKQLKSDADVRELLEEAGKGALRSVAQQFANQLQNNILDLLYKAYTPTSYKRTYDLVRAVTIDKTKYIYGGKQMQSTVYIDWKKLSIGKRRTGEWGTHVSVTNEDFRKSLIDVLESGSNGGLFKHDGRHFIQETMLWLEINQAAVVSGVTVADKTQYAYSDYGIADKIPTGVRLRKRK